MQLIDIIDAEKNPTEAPQGLNASLDVLSEITQGMNSAKSQDVEQTQNQCEKKLKCQDTFDQLHIAALKDVKAADEALLLLRNLRDGSQISDSAHESLSKVFMFLSKDKEDSAAEDDGTQSPTTRRNADMLDEAVLRAAGLKVPTRKSASRPFKHPSSKRQQLTSEEAAEIYSMRPEVAKGSSLRRGCMAKSKMIAPHFGVTPKTVRDIWHARTWVSATRHLWTEEEIAHRAKGVVESDEEDKNDSSSSASPTFAMDTKMQLQTLFPNFTGHFTSLPAISSLHDQAMMGGMSGLPLQLGFPSSLNHHFSSVGQQQAMSNLLLNGLGKQQPMGFPGCHPGLGVGAFNFILPEVSPSLLKL